MTKTQETTEHRGLEGDVKLTLLSDNFKNDLFNQNLSFFKNSHSSVYNALVNYKCKDFRLCLNPDGSPNILDVKHASPVYRLFTTADIIQEITNQLNNLPATVNIHKNSLPQSDEKWNINNPIQSSMLSRLYETGIFHSLNISSQNLTSLHNYTNNFLPLIRVYGIGLGYHLTELIKNKSINFITIYEPRLDLFYTSLFVTPWELIFRYFTRQGRGINLVLGSSPADALNRNQRFIGSKLMPLTSCFYRYIHIKDSRFTKMVQEERQSDEVARQASDSGWYEDQRIGLFNSARNIKKGNKYYTGTYLQKPFAVFVVGSGPSLNETIEIVQKHKGDAVIFSCGSAITPLLKAGIIPDYEIIQERLWHFPKHEEKHDLKLVKKVSLIKLNVISPISDKYYKETLIIQKFRDPGSSLLGNGYAITTAVNPTVTNAGIAIAATLGADKIYLFGVDYGAPRESEKMHAANTIHDRPEVDDTVKSKTIFDLPGNLGAAIRTTSVLSWSLRTTEKKIAEYPDIQWFNVGEGALIAGALPVKPEEFPKLPKTKAKKEEIKQQITHCFSNDYSSDQILRYLKTEQMQQIEEYFEAILDFAASNPQSREEIIHVLTLLYAAVNTGQETSSYLPSSLLPYGLKQFITNVFTQTSLYKDDQEAVGFYKSAIEILRQYIFDIKADLNEILVFLDREEETELLKVW